MGGLLAHAGKHSITDNISIFRIVDLLCCLGYRRIDRPFGDDTPLKCGNRVLCRPGKRFTGSGRLLCLLVRTIIASAASTEDENDRQQRDDTETDQ